MENTVFCKGITNNIEMVTITKKSASGIEGIVQSGVHKSKVVFVSNENIIKGKCKKEYTGKGEKSNFRIMEFSYTSEDILEAWEMYIETNSDSIFDDGENGYIEYSIYLIDSTLDLENMNYNYKQFKKMIK